MDFYGALTRTYALYVKIEQAPSSNQGIGLFTHRYETSSGTAFLFILLSNPSKPGRGKIKDFEKILEKSQKSDKPISPKEIIVLADYLNSIYPQIRKTKDAVLGQLRTIMAGFRLQILPYNNLKFAFRDLNNPQIYMYEATDRGQFTAYINILGLKEEGLILAHERQIEFIVQQISKNVDPTSIKSLPALRTGNTFLDLSKGKSSIPIKQISPENAKQQFKNYVKKKASEQDVKDELQYATVIEQFSQESSDNEPEKEPEIQSPDPVGRMPFLKNKTSPQNPVPNPPQAGFPPPKPTIDASNPISASISPFGMPPTQGITSGQPNATDQLPAAKPDYTVITKGTIPVELNELKQKNEQLESEKNQFSTRIQALEGIVNQLNLQIQQKDQEIVIIPELKNQLNQAQTQIVQLTDTLTRQLQQKDQEIGQLRAYYAQQMGQMEQYQQYQQQYSNLLKEKDDKITELIKEVNSAKEKDLQISELEDTIEDLQNQLEFSFKTNEDLRSQLETSQNVTMSESKKLDDTISILISERENITKEKEELLNMVNQLKEDLKKRGAIERNPQDNPLDIKKEAVIEELMEENDMLAKAIKETDEENRRLLQKTQTQN